MSFITSINWLAFYNMLSSAKNRIYIALPNIDEALADLLICIRKEKQIDINICVDNTETAIRNGYGDIRGMDKLVSIGFKLKQSKGSRVAFFIVDNDGYFLFNESRILSADPAGYNAVKLDPFTIYRLIIHYFSATNEFENQQIVERLQSSIEEQREWIKQVNSEVQNGIATTIILPFNTREYTFIQEQIKKDPPLEPDLQRRIKTYNAKIQLVELKFSGGRIQNMLVEFPKKGLPIADEKLKGLLQSRIKLINNEEFLKENKEIKELQDRVEGLRKRYLTPLTCREGKSVLIKAFKESFQRELETLDENINSINSALPRIIVDAIEATKELVRQNLTTFFSKYPTEKQLSFEDTSVREYQVQRDIDKIIFSIKFPEPHKLSKHFLLKTNYYDFTWDDFQDSELLKEFERKKLLSSEDLEQIVEMKDAFGIKK